MRRLAALCATALLLTGLGACGSGSDIDGLTVSGDFGKEPKVEVDSLDESSPKSDTLIEGDGTKLTDSSVAKVHLLLAKGTDGTTLQSTYSNPEPQTIEVAGSQSWIKDILTGARVGSRIVYVTPLSKLNDGKGDPQRDLKATDDIVIVIDVVDTQAPPEKVEPPKDAPKVVEKNGTVTGLDFSDAPKEPPAEFQAIPLVNGSGTTVKEGDQISAHYLGAKWGSDKPFENSYTAGQPQQFPIASPGVIEGWVKGLVGVKAGSRVMLVIPPELGYGKKGQPAIDIGPTDTMVFVIDVLAVG